MLTQADLERERYESWHKGMLDYRHDLRMTREEGRQEGREEGRREATVPLAKLIQFCQCILNRPQTDRDELMSLSFEELTQLSETFIQDLDC